MAKTPIPWLWFKMESTVFFG